MSSSQLSQSQPIRSHRQRFGIWMLCYLHKYLYLFSWVLGKTLLCFTISAQCRKKGRKYLLSWIIFLACSCQWIMAQQFDLCCNNIYSSQMGKEDTWVEWWAYEEALHLLFFSRTGTSSSLLVTLDLVTVFLALTLLVLDRHARLIKAFKPCVFLKDHYV